MMNATQAAPYLPNNARHTANLRFSGRVAGKFLPYPHRPGANKAHYFAAAAREVMSRYNLRAITPANMAKMSSELYSLKVLSFNEHAALYFEPNIASNNPLSPQMPRDMIVEWETLIQQQGQSLQGQKQVKQSAQVLTLLKRLDLLSQSAHRNTPAT
jgi:hypothetical protein